jgi:hypothetical protein
METLPHEVTAAYSAVRRLAELVAALSDSHSSLMGDPNGVKFRFTPNEPPTTTDAYSFCDLYLVLERGSFQPDGVASPWGLWRCFGETSTGVMEGSRLKYLPGITTGTLFRRPGGAYLGYQLLQVTAVGDQPTVRLNPNVSAWASPESRRASWEALTAAYTPNPSAPRV